MSFIGLHFEISELCSMLQAVYEVNHASRLLCFTILFLLCVQYLCINSHQFDLMSDTLHVLTSFIEVDSVFTYLCLAVFQEASRVQLFVA